VLGKTKEDAEEAARFLGEIWLWYIGYVDDEGYEVPGHIRNSILDWYLQTGRYSPTATAHALMSFDAAFPKIGPYIYRTIQGHAPSPSFPEDVMEILVTHKNCVLPPGISMKIPKKVNEKEPVGRKQPSPKDDPGEAKSVRKK
jgi:hypothetical protein